MLNGNYQTVSSIMQRVYRTYGFDEINRIDVAEWLWEVMSYLGVVTAFVDKATDPATPITIANYRGTLPVDFYSLDNGMVREYATKTPMRYGADVGGLLSDSDNNITVPSYTEPLGMSYDGTGVTEITQLIQINTTLFKDSQLTYKLTNGYIYTGFDSGQIEMQYQAFPIDTTSDPSSLDYMMPLVPDDAKYIRAVVDFIGERIAFKKVITGKIDPKVYELINQNYCFSAGAAKTHAATPNLAMMESIKNRSFRLIQTNTEFWSNFKYLGDEQLLKNI